MRTKNKRVVLWLSDKQYDWLKSYCDSVDLSINDVLSIALKDYYEKVRAHY